MTNLFLWLSGGPVGWRKVLVLGTMMLATLNVGLAQETYRVVTFGDSTTANRGAGKTYSTQLAKEFPNIEVINKGVGGNTTAKAAERFPTDVLDQHPNLVVIQFGINDAAFDVWKNPPATSSRVRVEDYEKNIRRFVDEARAAGSEVILMTPNQVRWTPNLLKKYGKPPYDPTVPEGASVILAKYAQCVRDLAHELQVPLVDVWAFYDTPERRHSACADLLPDGLHPTEEGHAEVAQALGKLIGPKIPNHSSDSSVHKPSKSAH